MSNGIIERMQAEIDALKSQVAELNAMHGIQTVDSRGDITAECQPKITYAVDFTALAEAFEANKPQSFTPTKLTPLTPQDVRDSIVEQAKRDVAELEHEQRANLLRMKYVVNAEKRTVVCLAERFDLGYIRAKGIAKCAPSDCFNAHIGKAISLRRALGLEVPTEYLTAPQPTEVRVGDVVKCHTEAYCDIPYEVIRVENGRAYDEEGCGFVPVDSLTIIDDTHDGESE
jgi:hypothetical protein